MSNEPKPTTPPSAGPSWPAPASGGASGWLPAPRPVARPTAGSGAQPPFGPYAPPGGLLPPAATTPDAPAPQTQPPALGGPPPSPVDQASGAIERYRAPRRTRQRLLLALGALVVGGVIAALVLRPQAPPPAAPPPTTSSAATTPGVAASGHPFTMPSDPQSTGTWEIVEHRWTADGLVMRIRVTALTGTCSYGFIAFAQGASSVSRPEVSTYAPALTTGMLSAGESDEGFVVFDIPQGDTTVILTTLLGRQISALPVKA